MSTVTVTQHQEQLARDLVAQAPEPQFTTASEGVAVEVPAELGTLLLDVLRSLAEGRSVTLKALPSELTTTVAAAELGVSRPTLMRMIREDEIPAHKVGTHHRLKLVDVQKFRRARLRRQLAAFENLRQLEDELGLE